MKKLAERKSRSKIDASEVRALRLPRSGSHKGDNGRLLVIAGSRKYHGSLLFAVKAAAKIVDLLYVLTTRNNRPLIKNLKDETAEFITVSRWHEAFHEVDCVLIGPGMGVSAHTREMVRRVLVSGKKAVLDADALKVLDEKLRKRLGEKHILTPHHGEFRQAFGIEATAENARKMAKRYRCTIVLKGKIDVVGSPSGAIQYNYTGNVGMTKGGTGDVLAGLTAALYCKNSAHEAATAGIYLNGAAGDRLYKKVGPFFDSEDLLAELPGTLRHLRK